MTAHPDPKSLKTAESLKPAQVPELEPYYSRERDAAVQLETLDALEQHYAYYTRD